MPSIKYIGSGAINVRLTPNTLNPDDRIGRIFPNQTLEVLGTHQGDDYLWFNVNWFGHNAWVANIANAWDVISPTEINRNDSTSPDESPINLEELYRETDNVEVAQTPDWSSFEELNKFRLFRSENDVRKLTMMNRFRLPNPDGVMSTKEFIFMTRPDLNLLTMSMEGRVVFNEDVSRLPLFRYVSRLPRGDYIIKSLQSSWLSDYRSLFLPIVTNSVKSYSPIDNELDSVERGETFHGHKILYGKHNFKSTFSGSMTLNFLDNRDLMLYLTVKLWREYIHNISIGIIRPKKIHVHNGILDYPVSLYYVVTKEDMEEIVYWEKLLGVFPTSVPNSIFEYRDNDPTKVLNFPVNFAYSDRDDMNPLILAEINYLYEMRTRGTFQPNIIPNHLPEFDMHGVPYVNGPYIVTKNNKYYLKWV